MRISWQVLGILLMSALGARADVDEGAFLDRCGRLADEASAAGTSVIKGRDGWLFFAQELRHLGAGPFWGERAVEVSRATRADAADPLPAILAFKHELDQRGVKLIMVPVPPKAVVYPDKLPDPDDGTWKEPPLRRDPQHQAFYDLLRSEGIEVLDLTGHFLDNRHHERGSLYCRQDTHWSGAGAVLAAEQIAAFLRRELNLPDREALDAEWRTVEITGDLWRMLNDRDLARERLHLRMIGAPSPPEPDRDSPILLLGDSHNLVFHGGGDMHARGAGLPDQLAYELGWAVDVVAVRGSGATPARINLLRRAQRDPEFWDTKEIVIWCFSAREFTESDGWRIVPVAP